MHHVFGNHPFYSTTWWCTSVYPARNHNLLTTSFSVPHTFVEKYVHYTKAARKQHHQPKKYTSSFSISLCVEQWNYSPTKKKKTFNHLLVRQIGGEYLLLTTAPIFWHFRVSSTTINFNGSPMISIFFQPITILALLYWYVSTMDWGQIRIGRLYIAYCCIRMGSDKKSIISFFHRLAKSMFNT